MRLASSDQLHASLRVCIYIPVVVLAAWLCTALVRAGLLSLPTFLPWLLPTAMTPEVSATAARPAGTAVSVLAVSWWFRRSLDRRSFRSLGLGLGPGWIPELACGCVLGALMMFLIALAGLALGAYRLVAPRPTGAMGDLAVVFAPLAAFAVVALTEELLARGYILQNLAEAWGVRTGVVASSLLFALGHLGNPGAGFLPAAGVLVAGLLLAAAYLATGRLWLPIGLHWSWNFVQGPVLGFPVSGVTTGGILAAESIGPELLTGGPFGPEAGLIALAVEVAAIVLLRGWVARPFRAG